MLKMSKVVMAEVTMEGCLLDMPYEILFEIFRGLSESKLIEISRLCSTFRDVAGDTRIWKDVYIEYGHETFAFEDLYSEPWPVKAIDLSGTEIKPPVSSKIDQVIQVTKLNMSIIRANSVTMGAIFAKYQCKELTLDFNRVDCLEGIAPEAFKKQTTLEELSLRCIGQTKLDERGISISLPYKQWLGSVLRNCQNLKTLSLSFMAFDDFEGRVKGFVESLPTSLEKLYLPSCSTFPSPADYFFDLLAGNIPNLRELGIHLSHVKRTALLKFQLLEALHIFYWHHEQYNISDFCMYLMKFPALKTIHWSDDDQGTNSPRTVFEKFRTMLEPHDISVRPTEESKYFNVGGHIWHVSNKAM